LEFQHRAQTNEMLVVGEIISAPKIGFLVNALTGEVYATNQKTGKPLEIATFSIAVDQQNGDRTYVDVEGVGDLAINAALLKRRATVQLSGRLIVTNSEKNGTWYQNAKLRLIDRTMDQDGNPREDGIPAIAVVAPNTRHRAVVTYFGTVGKRGVEFSPTNRGQVRGRFAAANNYGTADKPKTSWIDNTAYGEVAKDLNGIGKGTLLRITGRFNSYKQVTENGSKRRFEVIVSSVEPIAKGGGTPAPAAPAAAASESDAMAAALGLPPETGAINPSDTGNGEHEGSFTDAETLAQELVDQGAAAPGTAKPKRARKSDTAELPAAA
jgi:single-stranded DNA-binding protein